MGVKRHGEFFQVDVTDESCHGLGHVGAVAEQHLVQNDS